MFPTVKTFNGRLRYKIGKHCNRTFPHGDSDPFTVNKSNTNAIPNCVVVKIIAPLDAGDVEECNFIKARF